MHLKVYGRFEMVIEIIACSKGGQLPVTTFQQEMISGKTFSFL